MRTWQKILLAVAVLVMILLVIFTWGSVASILFASALLMIGPVYLFNRFINNDDGSDFDDDNP